MLPQAAFTAYGKHLGALAYFQILDSHTLTRAQRPKPQNYFPCSKAAIPNIGYLEGVLDYSLDSVVGDIVKTGVIETIIRIDSL